MYCSNCGTKNEGNNYCTKCGIRMDNVVVNKNDNSGLKVASIVLGVIGLVFDFLIVLSPLGFILSLIGLILGIVSLKSVKNTIGIVLNGIVLFLSIIILIAMVWFIRMIVSYGSIDDYVDSYYEYEYRYDM